MENTITKSTKERNSSFELLRIIVMLFIIFSHFAVHAGYTFTSEDITFNRFYLYFILLGGKVGVNIFVLISGYFLIEKDGLGINIKKILKLWGQMVFYSILIYIVFVLFFNVKFEVKTFLECFTPILSHNWWFANTYLLLFIIHPFINIGLKKTDQKAHKLIIITLLILWCVIPTLFGNLYESNSLLWFITLYIIGSYIKIYGLNSKFKAKHYLIFHLLITLLTLIITSSIILIKYKEPISNIGIIRYIEQYQLCIVLMSFSLFMFFERLNMKNYKWINIISSATFGVYLLHDHYSTRNYLWIDLFKNLNYVNSSWLMLYSIGVCLLVFVVCTIIDLIRMYTIEVIYLKAVNKYTDYLVKPFKFVIKKVSNLIFGDE